ncbi:hypothetical protein NECAME_09667 [Necator americanus]|uniref:Uncharacterized protein n=1 Tax=Necator americanus TaxID=51031 RepID=W2TCW7_NECAM|nr:hypothetical protein NECAME_09667 [Necator americanus]ETN79683.1 hypothetical protein NECAME_09667 [Necator americanus]
MSLMTHRSVTSDAVGVTATLVTFQVEIAAIACGGAVLEGIRGGGVVLARLEFLAQFIVFLIVVSHTLRQYAQSRAMVVRVTIVATSPWFAAPVGTMPSAQTKTTANSVPRRFNTGHNEGAVAVMQPFGEPECASHETDTEQFSTKFDDDDGPDVFVFFKETMEHFLKLCVEAILRDLTLVMTLKHSRSFVQNLRLQELSRHVLVFIRTQLRPSPIFLQNESSSLSGWWYKVCEQHVRSEESKRVEQAGGYNFNPAAAVPTSFNFTR